MFKHILVPLDGSRMAESAVPAAAYLAARLHARVTLIHVVEKNAPSTVHGQAHLGDAQEAAAYLDEIARQGLPPGVRVDCHVHTAAVEDVARSIVDHGAELGHDLVIMCSHGRGRALHLFLGSIAQEVIAGDSRPVLIAHPDERGEPRPFNCRNILIPLDGDPEHAQALPVSKELALACEASLHLAMVIPRFMNLSGSMAVPGSRMLPATTSRMLDMALQDAEAYSAGLVKGLQGQGFSVSGHVLRGDPAKIIVEAADRAAIDLIALATHGKTGMEAFWAGSVTNKICSQSKVPLLLVPVAKG
jgi:nucleotide-binding universal stress UspA family protein